MKDGHVKLNIKNLLLLGVAGSGKTCLKHLLFDLPPPEQRNSTPCMEKPVRAIRPVSSSKVQATERGWIEISQDKLLGSLAQIIARKGFAHLVTSNISETVQEVTSTSTDSNIDPHYSKESVEDKSLIIDGDIAESIGSVVSDVAQALKEIAQKDEPSLTEVEGGELFDSTWVYISDCGGQPQFNDIIHLFVHHISVAMVVFRLTDDFSSYPLDEYYKSGQLVGPPHVSHMTLWETLKSVIRSIESHCSQEKRPNLMFIGTFLDKVMSMVSLEEKNSAILEMLSANMKKQLLYGKSWKHAIFAVNTLSRDENVQDTAEDIRIAIESCLAVEINFPIWWFFLDINLQKLCLRLARGVLRKQECLQLASRFGFGPKDLEAALIFFDEVCIAHYYPSILPDTVFVNAQIPLDKITELTEHAILLRNGNDRSGSCRIKRGEWKRLSDEGVITLEFLKLPNFKKHYVEGVFSPEDMLLIMKELLVIAPIPLLGESDCPLSKAEFFMPSLLKSCPAAEVEQYRIASDSISPIAIFFPSGCIRTGVFCCLAVYLIKIAHWKVLLPSGEPVLLAKNCIQFLIPNCPCTITLIDSFSYIEVYVKAHTSFGKKLCPKIRNELLNGIKAACDVLHYNNDTPQISIFCPCPKSSDKVHLAEVNKDGCWICLSQASVWGDLTPKSLVWWNESQDKPGN